MKFFITITLIICYSFVYSQENKSTALVFYKKEKHLIKNRVKDKWTKRGIVMKEDYYYWIRLENGKTIFGRIGRIDSASINFIGVLKRGKNRWILSSEEFECKIKNIVGVLLMSDDLYGYIRDVSLANYRFALIDTPREYYPIIVNRGDGRKINAYPILTVNGVGFINPEDSIPKAFAVRPQ